MSSNEPPRKERDFEILINKKLEEREFPGKVEVYSVKRDIIGLMYFSETKKNLIVYPWNSHLPDDLNVSGLIGKIKETEKKLKNLHYIA